MLLRSLEIHKIISQETEDARPARFKCAVRVVRIIGEMVVVEGKTLFVQALHNLVGHLG
jgi:hypothetical protein